MPEPSRLVVGNLDLEVELARAAGAQIPAPRRAVTEMISVAASTLTVFARPGDRIWTPASVDARRVRGADDIELVSGPLAAQAPAGAILAWGETPAVASLRNRAPVSPAADETWIDQLWRLYPPVAAALDGNHRGFAHRLASARGLALPGARMIGSAAELAAHLGQGGAADGRGAWVAKAAYSAAGRERVRGSGEPTGEQASHLTRLLARGPLLFQPWVERLIDVGVVGLVDGDTVRLWPPHRLEIDAAGVFRGIAMVDASRDGLTDDERRTVTGAARAAGQALAQIGYAGPFGIDGFVYRDPAGQRRLAALGEINARLTFGHVARAHAEAAGWHGARFGLGRGPAPPDARTLVEAAAPDQTCAWLAPADATC